MRQWEKGGKWEWTSNLGHPQGCGSQKQVALFVQRIWSHKNNILSPFTHLYVVPNWYDFFCGPKKKTVKKEKQ